MQQYFAHFFSLINMPEFKCESDFVESMAEISQPMFVNFNGAWRFYVPLTWNIDETISKLNELSLTDVHDLTVWRGGHMLE